MRGLSLIQHKVCRISRHWCPPELGVAIGMAGLRCLTGTRPFLRGATCLQQAAVVNGGDRELSVKARSAKPKLWTLKDPRPSRERQARPQRQEYLTQRQAAFAKEQEKASALGLDWSIRSAL